MSDNKKWITFSNFVPNDQNSRIPSDSLDFTRYVLNPVVLSDHNWHSRAVAMMRDIHREGDNWVGWPEFHGITEESKRDKEMYEKGFLVSASIGGEMILKTTGDFQWITDEETKQQKKVPVLYKDEDGYNIAEKFYVYEISLPTLPSNFTAVTDDALKNAEALRSAYQEAYNKLGVKVFRKEESENVYSTIVTLSSDFTKVINKNASQMTDEEKQAKAAADEKAKAAEKLQADQAAKEAADKAAAEAALKDNSAHVILGAGEGMPGFIKKLIQKNGVFATIFGGKPLVTEPDDDDKPQVVKPKKDTLPTTPHVGLSAKEKAEEAVNKVKEAKKDLDDCTDEGQKVKFKEAYEKACKEADVCVKEAEAEEEAKAKKEAEAKAEEEAKVKAEEEAKAEAAKKESEAKVKAEESALEAEKVKLASGKPIQKTKAELEALKLAPKPEIKVTMGTEKTFTQLRADKTEGERILGRIFNGGKKDDGAVTIQDYATVLQSILNTPKYRAIAEKVRVLNANSMPQFEEIRNNVNANPKRLPH